MLLGQFVSQLGSTTSGFAIGVWIYEETGSVTYLAVSNVAVVLPFIVVAPLAGAMVDRWDRRWILVLCDAGAALGPLGLLLLMYLNAITPLACVGAVAVVAVFGAIQLPAAQSSIVLLVPPRHSDRAAGMVSLMKAASVMGGPPLGALLFVQVGLEAVLLVDLVTFVLAVVLLFGIRMPASLGTETTAGGASSLGRDIAEGWRYLTQRAGFFSLMMLLGFIYFTVATIECLIVPLVLGFGNAVSLSGVAVALEVGVLVGAVAMTIFGAPRRLVPLLCGAGLLLALCVGTVALLGNVLVLIVAAFLVGIQGAVTGTSVQVLFQRKVEPRMQGRVFATANAAARLGMPIAFVVAGPAADLFFEPALASTGSLAPTVGQWWGVGPGRGIAFMLLVLAALMGVVSLVMAAYAPLRKLDLLPDVTAEGGREAAAAPVPQL